jgi:ABC-type Fe3+/spermidine/putrescine transport system ATPase subunit
MAKELVTIERVTKVFESEGVTALANVSLVAHAGESLVLIGPSGSGKTTCSA